MRRFLYAGIAVLGAASIATAAVMGGGSSEECSMSKRSCSARKEMKAAAAVQTNDASMKVVQVSDTKVAAKSEKNDCPLSSLFGCGD